MDTSEITFIEETHQYIRNGINYDSVSSVISFFQKEFQQDMLSRVVAKSRGVTQADILKEWDDKRDEACRWGTAVHTALEKVELKEYDLEEVYPEYQERITPIVESYKSWRAGVKGKSKPEIRLWSDDHGVAGTCDLPIFQGKHVDIYDFKTNEKMTFSSKYNDWFKEPFQYLSDCKFNRYGIQLSIYAYMLELRGFKPRKLCLLWIDADGNIHEIHFPYLRKLAEDMLSFYRVLNPVL